MEGRSRDKDHCFSSSCAQKAVVEVVFGITICGEVRAERRGGRGTKGCQTHDGRRVIKARPLITLSALSVVVVLLSDATVIGARESSCNKEQDDGRTMRR